MEGTVYPALTRLEREGWLSARLVASPAGPARKYYRPTEAGRRELAAGTEAWNRLTAIVDDTLSRPLPAEPSRPAPADS